MADVRIPLMWPVPPEPPSAYEQWRMLRDRDLRMTGHGRTDVPGFGVRGWKRVAKFMLITVAAGCALSMWIGL